MGLDSSVTAGASPRRPCGFRSLAGNVSERRGDDVERKAFSQFGLSGGPQVLEKLGPGFHPGTPNDPDELPK